jgi:2-polyprenyl-3-methyl-5-hydroxy-6-metoxy-1,4-benzoquinol methylase
MSKDEMTAFSYLQHTSYRNHVDLKKLNLIISWISSYCTSTPRVLEIGCGTGNISRPMASLGWEVVATDLDPTSVEWARAHCPFLNVHFVVADILYNTLDYGMFDAVVLSEVLEHLSEPAIALQRIRNVMNADAVLVVTTPNGYGPYELNNALRGCMRNALGRLGLLDTLRRIRGKKEILADRGISTLNPCTPHVQFFTPASLQGLLEGSGFRILQWRNSDFMSFGWMRSVQWLAAIDCTLADHLPRSMVSGWYLLCQKI